MNKASVLKDIIESRRSTFPKDYTDSEIDQNILEEIVNSGKFAPNHKKTKPWRLKIFRTAEKAELGQKLAEIYKETVAPQNFLEKKYLDIPSKITMADTIVTISVNFSGLLPEWEEIAATSMAVQNMYLTAHAHQIGCYWSSPAMIQHLNEFLNLEENQRCIGLFYMGNLKTV